MTPEDGKIVKSLYSGPDILQTNVTFRLFYGI